MIGEQTVIDFVTSQRWFGSKTQTVIHAEVVDRAVLRDTEPTLELRLVELASRPASTRRTSWWSANRSTRSRIRAGCASWCT